ncbi:ribulose-phosphate 3-epimerase [Vibrio sp. SA48]
MRVKKSPSIICADLMNLERSLGELDTLNIDAIHIDIIDGYFSPSMPLGLDIIKEMRKVCTTPFDIHLMTKNNEWFVEQLLDVDVQQITFHYETTLHIDRLISKIKSKGINVGVALNPATDISVLKTILPYIDTVLIMTINPGFASHKGEDMVEYAYDKIKSLRDMAEEIGTSIDIQVDGRVSLERIPELVKCGATDLVLGSKSLFLQENTLLENSQLVDVSISKAKGVQYV